MLAKALTFAATLPAVMAFQEADASFSSSQMAPQELGTMDLVGSTPCIFKLGDSFYDFTPIKVAYPNPTAPYYNIISRQKEYDFVWGWCQELSAVSEQPLCKKDFFAGRLDANPEPTPDSECMAYSGNSKDDI